MIWPALILVVGGLAATVITLWFRTRNEQIEKRVSAQVDASIEKFRAQAAGQALDAAAEDAKIIEEAAREVPRNADLPRTRDGNDERLLRAAQDAGGDEARAELEALLHARKPSDTVH